MKGFWLIALMSVLGGLIAGAVEYVLTSGARSSMTLVLLGFGIPIVYLLVINYTKQTGKLAQVAEAVIAFAIYSFAIAIGHGILTTYTNFWLKFF